MFDYFVLLFFLVSFFGWGWEVGLYLVREGRFVNRGILSGPWLPIYGAGGLFLYLLFTNPLLNNCLSGKQHDGRIRKPLPVFMISMTICSVLEYLAGSLLEKEWGIKWWDYSGMPFNLNGHICLMSCLMFGVGGLFLVFVLLPLHTGLYHRIPEKVRLAAVFLLLGAFVMDAAHSADFPNIGRGITYRG